MNEETTKTRYISAIWYELVARIAQAQSFIRFSMGVVHRDAAPPYLYGRFWV